MSKKTDTDYLHDMLEYAEHAHGLVSGREMDDLDADSTFRFALQYCVLIIGEAAGRVSQPTREKMSIIPWREITGMRNWLVHGYSSIRAQTLWDTATRDLPKLIDDILAFLPPEQT